MTKPQEYIECPRIHSTQDYKINKPSLKDLNLGSCLQEEGSESWLGFNLSFLKGTKQNTSRYHVENNDKLNKQETCV